MFRSEISKMSIIDILVLDTQINNLINNDDNNINNLKEHIKEHLMNEIIKLPLCELLKIDEEIIYNNINKDKQDLIRKAIYNKMYFFNHC